MKADSLPYYYTVGGRVHYDESTQEAVRREVQEELGIDLEIDRPLFLHESFFDDVYSGDHFHEIAVYYLMKNSGALDHIVCDSVTSMNDREQCHWIALEDLDRVEALPKAVFSELNQLPSSLKLIVERN